MLPSPGNQASDPSQAQQASRVEPSQAAQVSGHTHTRTQVACPPVSLCLSSVCPSPPSLVYGYSSGTLGTGAPRVFGVSFARLRQMPRRRYAMRRDATRRALEFFITIIIIKHALNKQLEI